MLFCLLFRSQVSVSQTNLSWIPLKAALPFVAPFLPSHNHLSCTCLGIAFSPPSQTPLFWEFSCQGSCPTVKRTLLWLQTFGFCPNILRPAHFSIVCGKWAVFENIYSVNFWRLFGCFEKAFNLPNIICTRMLEKINCVSANNR